MATTYTDLASQDALVRTFCSATPFVVQETFNLTGLDDVLVDADVVNLFTLPANTLVTDAILEVTGAGTSATTGTQTVKLRVGTTDITAALNGKATGLTHSTAKYTGAAEATVNVIAAVATDVVTKNPTIRVTLICVNI